MPTSPSCWFSLLISQPILIKLPWFPLAVATIGGVGEFSDRELCQLWFSLGCLCRITQHADFLILPANWCCFGCDSYTVFYGKPDIALGLFIFAMLQTIILSLYTVLAPMIQALFQNRKAIIYFLYGVGAQVGAASTLIYIFKAYGPLFCDDSVWLSQSCSFIRNSARWPES